MKQMSPEQYDECRLTAPSIHAAGSCRISLVKHVSCQTSLPTARTIARSRIIIAHLTTMTQFLQHP